MKRQRRRVALMLDLQWPYKRHSQVFAGITQYAEEQGWETIIDEFAHHTISNRREKTVPYDGILARANHQLARAAARRGIPVVNVWPSSPARVHTPGVFPDSTAVGRMVAEHFLSRGFRAFATLTSPKNVDNELELKELSRVVNQLGFTCLSVYLPQNPHRNISTWRKTERLIHQAMETWKPPIGVYVSQEECARLVMQVGHRRGWQIPRDIAIVAGKNEVLLCEKPRPSLTSIEIGYDRIGYAAAELLDRMMRGEAVPGHPVRLAPLGLVVRESTDFFAVDHPVVASALAYIAANSHRSINPGDVASAVSTETRTLQNYFNKTIQRPIAMVIRRVRIERAKRELTQSTRGLAEIARETGFNNIQRLYEVFRREVGISPSAYRRQRMMKN